MDFNANRGQLERFYVSQIVAQLAPSMAGVDPSLLRAVAHEAVADLTRGGVRIADFVPDLALRIVRDAVAHRPTAPVPAPVAG